MPSKETPEELLSKHLGKDQAKKMLNKIDKMLHEGASVGNIEEEMNNEIASYMENQINNILVVKAGPIEPIKIKPIQVAIKPTIKPIPAIKVSTGLSVKIGPEISVPRR